MSEGFLIAIVETAILYQGKNLLEEQFYSTDDVLDKSIRNGLLQTIKTLTSEAFGEDVQSFTLGEYAIIMASHDLEGSNSQNLDKELETIMMYYIIDKKTDEKAVLKAINEVLAHFLNRYSYYDIQQMKLRKFRKFKPRLKAIFGDLTLLSEDRFKSLF